MSDLKDTAVDNDDLMSDLDDDIDLLVIDDLEIDNLQETEPEFIRSSEVSRYLRDISQFPRISKEEELELAKSIKAGVTAKKELAASTNPDEIILLQNLISVGEKARETFINANYKLVVAIAKHFLYACNSTLTFLDLIQVGNLGLMYAVDRFDYTRGLKFSTFATWWIQQRIRRDIQDVNNIIRIPVHVQDTLSKIRRLELSTNHRLSTEELGELMGMTTAKIERLLQIRNNMSIVYLDQLITSDNGDGEASLLDVLESDTLSPADIFKQAELTDYLYAVMSTRLTDRELYILLERFGFLDDKPKTLESLGQTLNITRERVRQLEFNALRKLKTKRIKNELRVLLGIK